MTRFEASGRYLLQEAAASLKHVPRQDIDALLEALEAARHVVIFGRGRSGNIGRAFAIRLSHLGFRSFFVGETATPPVSDEDVVLLVSGSGDTFSVVLTAKIAQDLDAKVVCVTADADSQLAEQCDLVVTLPGPQAERQPELAPLGTAFELTAHLFFDGLVAELMEHLGEDETSMSQRHATLE